MGRRRLLVARRRRDEDHGSDRVPIDYEAWPFAARMAAARERGQVRAWCVGLGVDPLSDAFTVEVLAGLLAGERGHVKGVLTQQSLIAGLGNAYSDEVLWEVGLSPFKPARNLAADDVSRLHAAIVDTLRGAVGRAQGLAAKDLKSEKKSGLNVHGRTGLPCPRCGDTIREVSFADKSLQYCATCQTGGKPLADRRLSKLLK